ncbi:hypothetical protein [Streptomyces niveus]|uniref:hypothetical protein n=1 Tax=Streptomyces niveus TaxID=193462 RepID=UPI00386B3DCC
MPAYLISHDKGARGDILIEDPELTLTFSGDWAIFSDAQGPHLAIPAEQGVSIQRVDEDQDAKPAG